MTYVGDHPFNGDDLPMKRLTALTILTLTTLCGCAHLAESNATFAGSANNGSGPLILRVARHMDTIVNGPDIEEDQLLVLELRNFQLNQKLPIPSASVKSSFTVTRFGPSSRGIGERGYIMVKSVSEDTVVAYLDLQVTALTSDGTYKEQAKFHGVFTFRRGGAND